jgi:hypothetical protein
LDNGIKGVADVVMEAGFVALGETASKKVVAEGVEAAGAVRALRQERGIEERQAELSSEKELIGIGREAVILKVAREGVKGGGGGDGE